jgi:hypothetical protein
VGNELLISLTQLSDYLGMLISIWLMFYLFARGYSNPLTLRMALILLAISLYFYNAFSNTFLGAESPTSIAAFAVIIALGACYDLSTRILPANLRKKQRPFTIGIFVFGILATFTLILEPASGPLPEDLNYFVQTTSAYLLVDIYDFVTAAAILYNFRLILKTKSELLQHTFYAFIIFSVSTIAYGAISMIFQIPLPRFVSNLLVLTSFVFLGYSIARYQSLVDSRISVRDFPITAISILAFALSYAYAARKFELSLPITALFAALAIVTHSVYDLIREILNGYLFRREQSYRRELRQLSRNALPQSLYASLRRALAILCHNLSASSGFIALKEGDQFLVQTSYHAMPVGAPLNINESSQEELFQPAGDLSKHASWARWVYAGNQPIGLLGVGPRAELRTYTEPDLDWLEDVADQIGAMLQANLLPHQQPLPSTTIANQFSSESNLLSTLAMQPDAEVIKTVEEGFRHLNDYIKLGNSPLTDFLSIEGETHIERGKAIQVKLINTLESLRPSGDLPPEPLPRAWYSFTILHDAYVQEIPDRDIMAKLYISEGTFYRTRRKALRGVSRALMEAETLA